jgi:exosortase
LVWKFLPAFLALGFLIPLTSTRRQIIAAPMQTVTARYTQEACELVGMDVGRSGNVLRINGNDIQVVEACNGMRMVITLFLVCYVLAFGSPFRWYVRALILLASPLVAIACNVGRLVPTVWMYGGGATKAAERFHDLAGWVMLVVAFVLLRGLLGLLRWASVPVAKYRLLVG